MPLMKRCQASNGPGWKLLVAFCQGLNWPRLSKSKSRFSHSEDLGFQRVNLEFKWAGLDFQRIRD